MMTERNEALAALEVFVGEWSMEARFEAMPPADAGARRVRVAHWRAVPRSTLVGPRPGSAGWDRTDRAGYGDQRSRLQHYFDSRGVAHVYQMTRDDGVWKLGRDALDFSPLDFGQRFTGMTSRDGQVTEGAWEISHDGKSWQHDFDLTYRKHVSNLWGAIREIAPELRPPDVGSLRVSVMEPLPCPRART